MLGDLDFVSAIKNTFALVIIVVPLQLALALGMSMMLRHVRRGRDLILWIWTIPMGISDLAAGLVWLSILTEKGYLNTVLFHLGVIAQPESWLTYETPVALLRAVLVAELWRATAIVLVILVAGVQTGAEGISRKPPSVFGATPWQRFRRVTLPLLRPSIQTALILRTVLAFETFAIVLAIGGTNFPVLISQAFEVAAIRTGLRGRRCLCGAGDGGLDGGDSGLSDRAATRVRNRHERRHAPDSGPAPWHGTARQQPASAPSGAACSGPGSFALRLDSGADLSGGARRAGRRRRSSMRGPSRSGRFAGRRETLPPSLHAGHLAGDAAQRRGGGAVHGAVHRVGCAGRICAGALRLSRRHAVPADGAADARLPGRRSWRCRLTVGYMRLGLYDSVSAWR